MLRVMTHSPEISSCDVSIREKVAGTYLAPIFQVTVREVLPSLALPVWGHCLVWCHRFVWFTNLKVLERLSAVKKDSGIFLIYGV